MVSLFSDDPFSLFRPAGTTHLFLTWQCKVTCDVFSVQIAIHTTQTEPRSPWYRNSRYQSYRYTRGLRNRAKKREEQGEQMKDETIDDNDLFGESGWTSGPTVTAEEGAHSGDSCSSSLED